MLIDKIQLDSDEKILIQVRKHWFILATQFFGLVITASLPLLALLVVNYIPVFKSLEFNLSLPLFLASYSVWFIFIWLAGFKIWTNYYLDVWIITNKRLMAIDQQGLFHRHIGSFRLERLQDMNVAIHGLIATMLDYGSLEAQTASDDNNFMAHGLPHPRELKALILSASGARLDKTNTNPEPENFAV